MIEVHSKSSLFKISSIIQSVEKLKNDFEIREKSFSKTIQTQKESIEHLKNLLKNSEDEKAGMKGVLTRLGVEIKIGKTDS